jgi:hypothetical protein
MREHQAIEEIFWTSFRVRWLGKLALMLVAWMLLMITSCAVDESRWMAQRRNIQVSQFNDARQHVQEAREHKLMAQWCRYHLSQAPTKGAYMKIMTMDATYGDRSLQCVTWILLNGETP